jgi:hypothetical protein
MRRSAAAFACLLAGTSLAVAADKPTRFWNLTLNTITELSLAPAGTTNWGPNQCLNDPDKSVDHDERLTINGIESGRYDIEIADAKGRHCLAHNVEAKKGAVFSVSEKEIECPK